jgi:alpha-D-ribose 1-methylphosphonate 5-triphosphate diphosphatase
MLRARRTSPGPPSTVTSAPAEVTKLTDRGRLAPGLRADITRFSLQHDTPVVRGVWARGQRVS